MQGAFILVVAFCAVASVVAIVFHMTARRDPTQHIYRKWLAGRSHLSPGEVRADGNYRMAFAAIREIASIAVLKRPTDGLKIATLTWAAEIDKVARIDPETAKALRGGIERLRLRDLLLPEAFQAWWLHRESPTVHMRAAFRD